MSDVKDFKKKKKESGGRVYLTCLFLLFGAVGGVGAGLFNLFGIFGAVGEPAPTNCREFCHISVTSVTSRTLFVAELSPA
jgi:hypothetical protein